ncbi:MAG: hypothetical protein KAI89_06115 [Emcibacter sp.]|nr:hypothetical protein [Emcibacter sp.]
MKSLKGSIALLCSFGIYTMGAVAYAAPESGHDAVQEEKSLTSSILSYFSKTNEKKDVAAEVLLLGEPTKENAGQYITLSEPTSHLDLEQPDKKLTVTQSFAVKPSLIFNMGSSGFGSISPSGFSGFGATAAGNHVTFSYGSDGQVYDPDTLGLSIGSQFLVEPSSIMSPLFDGSEFDKINNRQVYNLSVDMGYAGFTAGASFSQEKNLYDPDLKGYDVGLGYAGRKWGADVKFGEYKRERALLFASTEEFYDTVYALEIGAAYQIHSNIRFTGRFTYYSYGQDNELEKIRSSQVFFLGTNVNF